MKPVTVVRDIRSDQYGIRAFLALEDLAIKFEIVREARIELSGQLDPNLHVPVLDAVDQCAEKLLANADRGLDGATACRDAIDLGVLCAALGTLPRQAVDKAETAYGADVSRKIWAVLKKLADQDMVRKVASALDMNVDAVILARDALSKAVLTVWSF